VRKKLDKREKNGYEVIEAKFFPRQEKQRDPFNLMLYIGTPDNSDYAGPAEEEDIANVIQNAKGFSGHNIDYLLNLADFVRNNIPEDEDAHLFKLEQLVKSKL